MATISTSLPTSLPVNLAATPTPWGAMTPIDRWRHSPPEDEPAPLDAIRLAVRGSSWGGGAASMPDPSQSPFDTTASRPNLLNSLETFSNPGTSSGSSSNSWSSAFSFGRRTDDGDDFNTQLPLRRQLRKRGQKRRQRYVATVESSSKKETQRIYRCTFCTDIFTSRYDWIRHEGTLHLPLWRV
ncbi:hypothetical protein F4803DRAFT_290741 [Xylaria telfairii]|nr:hypothetical protein F4803DRAFT_290741 [Xylaria telfairii]